MALIDLKSNLKNLKFGNDQPGYGSSGLPYIQTKMPGVIDPTGTFNPIFRPSSTGNLDYPIRGGNIDFQIGQQTYTLSSKIDQTRIKRFFEDKSRGTAFIQKQVGLQLTNPKMETGNTLFSIGQGLPFSGLLENTRVYNKGVNTLAQIGVSGTGAHALRHGLVPFAPLQKHYYAIVNAQNINNEPITNRLVNLNALKMTVGATPFVNPANVFDINTVNTLGISLNRNLLFQYLGGPGSAYGIGATTIKRTVDTTKLRSSTAMMYDQLKQQSSNKGSVVVSEAEGTTAVRFLGKSTYKLQDFRNGLDGLDGSYTPWGNKTIDQRFYVSPGKYKDSLNSSAPFVFNNSVAPWELESEVTSTDDLIKFVFEAISNDNPNYSLALFFRAFLTAGITDNHNAELNSFKYIGRGENFYTYQGFNRSIGFSFRMAAGSKQELIPMYNRLNALVSQVYPDYSSAGIMRAPLVRVTIGDYLSRVPGFLESVNITVDSGYPWEINLDADSAQLPQVVDVAVSFRPILDYLPKRSSILSVTDRNLDTNLNDFSTDSVVVGSVRNTPIITNADVIDITTDSTVKGIRPATADEIRMKQREVARNVQKDATFQADLQTRVNQNNQSLNVKSNLDSLKNKFSKPFVFNPSADFNIRQDNSTPIA
jgi:hypothetical protein